MDSSYLSIVVVPENVVVQESSGVQEILRRIQKMITIMILMRLLLKPT